MKRRLLAALLVLCALWLPLAALAGQARNLGELKVKCFKIGKADAYLLRIGQSSLMIDLGEEDDAQELIDYLKNRDIHQLDYLIISHFDKRSIGGGAEFLQSIKAKQVLLPAYEKGNERTAQLLQAMKGMPITRVTETMRFELEGLAVTVYPAKDSFYEDDEDNSFSLVVSVIHGDNSLLFPGDIMQGRIAQMIAAGELSPHRFIKMPAHGQNIPGLGQLLDAVQPEIALIPCSAKNPPAGAVIADLDARGIRWYATKDGAVSLSSDGYGLTVKQTMKDKNAD